jgi:hypothetical protein
VTLRFAGLYGPGQLNGPAEQKKLLRQGGLARVGVADDAKGSSFGDFSPMLLQRGWSFSFRVNKKRA